MDLANLEAKVAPEHSALIIIDMQKYLLKQAGITPNTWDREKAGIEVKR